MNNPPKTKARSFLFSLRREAVNFFNSFNRSIAIQASTQKFKSPFSPALVTGFTVVEGCFFISVVKDKTHKLGWQVEFSLKKGLPQLLQPRNAERALSYVMRAKGSLAAGTACFSWREKYKPLLEQIKNFWDASLISISKDGPKTWEIRVRSIEDLHKIIQHFDQYPLINQKRADFEFFKDAVYLIKNKQHFTKDGLGKIVAIKEAINLGISDLLKIYFPDITRVERPLLNNTRIFDAQWLAGFTAGEGFFIINILYSKNNKVGFQVRFCFQLTQHSRAAAKGEGDELLMISLEKFFKGGNFYSRKLAGKDAIDYRVLSLESITEIIIPLFKKIPILGVKSRNFFLYCKAAEFIKQKAPLTTRCACFSWGLDHISIRNIQGNMIRRRVWSLPCLSNSHRERDAGVLPLSEGRSHSVALRMAGVVVDKNPNLSPTQPNPLQGLIRGVLNTSLPSFSNSTENKRHFTTTPNFIATLPRIKREGCELQLILDIGGIVREGGTVKGDKINFNEGPRRWPVLIDVLKLIKKGLFKFKSAHIKVKYLLFLIKHIYDRNIKEIVGHNAAFKYKSKNYKPGIKEFFKLSMRVEFSEAIRWVPTSSSNMMTDLIFVILIYSIKLEPSLPPLGSLGGGGDNCLFFTKKTLEEDITSLTAPLATFPIPPLKGGGKGRESSSGCPLGLPPVPRSQPTLALPLGRLTIVSGEGRKRTPIRWAGERILYS